MRELAAGPTSRCMGEACSVPAPMGASALQVLDEEYDQYIQPPSSENY